MGSATLSYQDHSAETSIVRIRGANLDAVNITAKLAEVVAIEAAVNAVVLGFEFKKSINAEDTQFSGTLPIPDAQRERKWRVVARDNVTGQVVSVELPCANSAFLAANTDNFDTTTAEWTALKAALEAYWESIPGNPVTVESAVMVGRRG